jgi:mRNA-degrading endonuclease RelE of RelBE toxin-antitoxin system
LAWKVEWDERAFKEFEVLDRQAQKNILKYLKKNSITRNITDKKTLRCKKTVNLKILVEYL